MRPAVIKLLGQSRRSDELVRTVGYDVKRVYIDFHYWTSW
jgi:hypothetical protein